MYESNVSDEYLELERYGLEEGEIVSESDGSEVEGALYRQIHYNQKNSDKFQTDCASTILISSEADDPLTDLCNNDNNKVIDLCTSTDSDVIFIERTCPSQDANAKQKTKNTASKILNVVSSAVTKVVATATKINRNGLFSDKKERRRKKRKKKIIADRDAVKNMEEEAAEKTNDPPETPKSTVVEKSSCDVDRGREDGFFLDSKGMALDTVKQGMASAQSEWREEKERTKAMLKEKGKLVYIVDSSDDDCMMVQSCSEDESMHVHFDGKKAPSNDRTLEGQNKSFGQWKVKGKPEVRGRYFVQSKQKNIRCNNCFEVGHIRIECPKPPHIPACILCGVRGHTERSCKQTLCYNCSLPGHQLRACTFRKMRYAVCSRCQMPGHFKQLCTDQWRQYHITTKEKCLTKPAEIHPSSSARQQKDVYCCNCSKKGHRFYDCSAARFDEFTMFTYNEVAQYDGKFKVRQLPKGDEGPPSKRKRGLERQGVETTSNIPQTSGSSHQSKKHTNRQGCDEAVENRESKLSSRKRTHRGFVLDSDLLPLVDDGRVNNSQVSRDGSKDKPQGLVQGSSKNAAGKSTESKTIKVPVENCQIVPHMTRKMQRDFRKDLRKRGLLVSGSKIKDSSRLTADERATWDIVEGQRAERRKGREKQKEKIWESVKEEILERKEKMREDGPEANKKETRNIAMERFSGNAKSQQAFVKHLKFRGLLECGVAKKLHLWTEEETTMWEAVRKTKSEKREKRKQKKEARQERNRLAHEAKGIQAPQKLSKAEKRRARKEREAARRMYGMQSTDDFPRSQGQDQDTSSFSCSVTVSSSSAGRKVTKESGNDHERNCFVS